MASQNLMTFFDKCVASVSPSAALRRVAARQQLREMSLGYDSAESSRFRVQNAFVRSMPGSEDAAADNWTRTQMRLECIDLYRNNEVVNGIVKRIGEYTIWLGVQPTPATTNRGWNAITKKWWKEIYAPTCEVTGRYDMRQIQRMIVTAPFVFGEIFIQLLQNGQIELIETDRVTTPAELRDDKSINDGLHVVGGKVVGFYVCPRDSRGQVDTKTYTYVAAANMIHYYTPWRPDQLRGVPTLHAVINKIRDYDEADKYILNKVKAEGKILFKRTLADGSTPLDNMPRIGARTVASAGQQLHEQHEWGEIVNAKQGEDFAPMDTRTPNAQYVPYLQEQLRAIASAVGMPYEFLRLIFTAGSFTAQRAAALHAAHFFDDLHEDLITKVMRRLYNWRIAKAMKNRELPLAPIDGRGISEWYRVAWSVPYYGMISPTDETSANASAWNLGSDSLTSIITAQGRERDEVLDEKADDIAAAIARADKINNAAGRQLVTWKDLINSAVPGVSTAIDAEKDKDGDGVPDEMEQT